MSNTFETPFQERIQGLPASIDKHSAVLILGTLPGQMSLSQGKYYADPSNKFWDILFIACGEEIGKSDQAKEALLRKYNIALWDILDSAVRETSSDKDLTDEKPNDLPQLLAEYPNIKLLLFHSKGDINDPKYRQGLVDMLVNKIYLYDDKMTILCNTQDGHFDVDLKEISSLKGHLVAHCPPYPNLSHHQGK